MNKALVILLLIFQQLLFAQKEGNIWYFGDKAGLDFNSGYPVALNNGSLNTIEGCSTISDKNGDLLFYTDGRSVYNKNHVLMPNGFGLFGHSSSTQSSIILKQPGSSSVYYIFTVDGATGKQGGCYYSEINMLLDGGLGDVSIKNTPLFQKACEKITAVLHKNNRDFWIISPPDKSGFFNSYLLTSAGLNTTPIVSNNGFIHPDSFGYLKASQKGDKIVACVHSLNGSQVFFVYDFDNNTGVLSNKMTFSNFNGPQVYGAEFSPSGQYLYISDGVAFNISQYDLSLSSPTAIANSQTNIVSTGLPGGGALQLGPDNKIYAANWKVNGKSSISVINNPDAPGLFCNLSQSSVLLDSGKCEIGLPSFYNSIFQSSTINYINTCFGDSTCFNSKRSIDSLIWNFGDMNSGINNTSTDSMAYHIFSDTGYFDVMLISYSNNTIDTSSISIYINPFPIINIGSDTIICNGNPLLLNATKTNASYLWQDGSVNSTFNATQTGIYWVEVNVSNCTTTDTIHITFNPAPVVKLNKDTTICYIDTLILDVNTPNATYLWQDNSTLPTFIVTQDGTYWVEVTLNGCQSYDTIIVSAGDCYTQLEIPNVFTPNYDGSNDFFIPVQNEGIEEMHTFIYNRWGEQVFETKNLMIEWDGKDVADGTYFWVIYYKDINNRQKTVKGHLTLLR